MYGAKARLLDLRTQQVVAESTCLSPRPTEAGAPTYDELMDDNAAGLKRELDKLRENCAAQFIPAALSNGHN